jgi:hypothetical protein
VLFVLFVVFLCGLFGVFVGVVWVVELARAQQLVAEKFSTPEWLYRVP